MAKMKSLSTRMFIAFFLALVPLLITGALILDYSISIHRQNVTSYTHQSMEIVARDLDNELYRIQMELQGYRYENTSTISDLVRLPSTAKAYVYYGTLMRIQNSFKFTVQNNRLVDEVTLCYPRKDIRLSSRMGLSTIDNSLYTSILENYRTNSSSLLIAQQDSVLMLQTSPQNARSYPKTPIDYLLIAHISKTLLSESLLSGIYPHAPTFLFSGGIPVITVNGEPSVAIYAAQNDEIINWHGQRYVVYTASCQKTNCHVMKLLPYDQVYGIYRQLVRVSWFYVGLAIVASTFFIIYIRRMIHKPVQLLESGFDRVRQGNLNTHMPASHTISDFDKLYTGFNLMTLKLKTMKEQILQQELFNSKMELKQLQAQINPHFLYNAFFILKHHIQNGSMDSAEAMAEYMGSFFQYITRTGNEESTLADEYAHVESFLNIQKMRFMSRIQIDLAPLPPETKCLAVPRLIFQPLIENIFAHSSRTDDDIMKMAVHFFYSKQMIECIIEDNGNTLTKEHIQQMNARLANAELAAETTGMLNIHRRLQLRYGAAAGLSLSMSELGGLKVVMRIPQKTCPGSKEGK